MSNIVPEDSPLPPPKVLNLDNVRQTAFKLAETTHKPFVIVGEDVYCVEDRYQCGLLGMVKDKDVYEYNCPHCYALYEVRGQDFVDWCKFKGEVKRNVDEAGSEGQGSEDHSG